MKERYAKGLQDGLLAWYNSQAAASDSNVERRLDREPFDYRDLSYSSWLNKGMRIQNKPKDDGKL